MVYQPEGAVQNFISTLCKATFPYLSHFTYKFHVERARVAGLHIEDIYEHKFFKENYIHWHLYAQYFHPTTLLERVREISFYRKHAVLFKGFEVPDWAQTHKRDNYDVDIYSRMAWDNAQRDLESEWTPMQYSGDRLDPNALQWLRHEQWGQGHSSKLFYNEVPNPTWYRQGSSFTTKDLDKNVYSFTFGDQNNQHVFGFDTTTPEGRKALAEEVANWKQMTPEIFEGIEINEELDLKPMQSQEPHYQRVWNHYRQFQFRTRVAYLIENGDLDQEDVTRAQQFFDSNGLPSATLFAAAKRGLLGDVSQEPSFESFKKIMKLLSLDKVEIRSNTSQPVEEQFWDQFDQIFDLKDEDMHRYLPLFVTDARDQAKIEALDDGSFHLDSRETTTRLL